MSATSAYGIQLSLPVSYQDAIERVTAALKKEGFGILTEIDIKATLKEKLGAEFRPYMILGACNPTLAHHALNTELDVGLLLPCNVIIYQEDADSSSVSIIDPIAMFSVGADPELQIVADAPRKAVARCRELDCRHLMLAKVLSCAVVGLDAALVEVEVDIRRGQPSFSIVGLPGAAIRESRDRVAAAIKNSGLEFNPAKHLTVNLAPADLRKEGPAYDLPIAVGILAATQQVWLNKLEGALFIGELSLDGAVRPTKGIVSMAAMAREEEIERVFVPAANAPEAALPKSMSFQYKI